MSAIGSESGKQNENEPTLGRKIQDIRKDREMTRQQVANKMNVTVDVVKNHEKGFTQLKAEDLFEYMMIFKCNFEEVAPRKLLSILNQPQLENDSENSDIIELIGKLNDILASLDNKELIEHFIAVATICQNAHKSS